MKKIIFAGLTMISFPFFGASFRSRFELDPVVTQNGHPTQKSHATDGTRQQNQEGSRQWTSI
jgi:methionyl-tRNA formyltransferase